VEIVGATISQLEIGHTSPKTGERKCLKKSGQFFVTALFATRRISSGTSG
jgi:hypothetical protein